MAGRTCHHILDCGQRLYCSSWQPCKEKELSSRFTEISPDVSNVIWCKVEWQMQQFGDSWASLKMLRFLADFDGDSTVELSWILMLFWTEGLAGITTSWVLERLSWQWRSIIHSDISLKQDELCEGHVESGIISISMVRKKNACVDNQNRRGGVYLEAKRRQNQLLQ